MLFRFPILCSGSASRRPYAALELFPDRDDAMWPRAGITKWMAGRQEQRMRPIPIGAKGQFTLEVEPRHLANQVKDSILPPVFATPMMILAIENAALNAIREYLEPGESAVGTAVDVRHLAATPVGLTVTAEAEVTEVDGRRVVFAVTARDDIEEIGKGTHERRVVDLRRLTQKLEAKRAYE